MPGRDVKDDNLPEKKDEDLMFSIVCFIVIFCYIYHNNLISFLLMFVLSSVTNRMKIDTSL